MTFGDDLEIFQSDAVMISSRCWICSWLFCWVRSERRASNIHRKIPNPTSYRKLSTGSTDW